VIISKLYESLRVYVNQKLPLKPNKTRESIGNIGLVIVFLPEINYPVQFFSRKRT